MSQSDWGELQTLQDQCTVSAHFTSGLTSGGRMALPTSSTADTAAMYESSNHTNGSDCTNTADWITTVIPVYVLLIAVLGIVFNVFVLLVFCLHKKPCTIAEIYLSNLAAADLVLVALLPFWAIYIFNDFNWPFGWFLCKVVNLGISVNACCSVFFLLLVSIDRYGVLVHTLYCNRMRRPKYAKLCCLIVWVLSFLLCVPIFIYREVTHGCNAEVCYLNFPSKLKHSIYDGILTVFCFIIPMSIISYCTVNIIRSLKNRSVEGINSQKKEHKATILVLAVLLAFLICWVPFHLIRALEVFVRVKLLTVNFTILDICFQIFTYLAFFNSALNPILYVIVGKNFREKVKEVFKQKRAEVTFGISSVRSNLMKSTKSVNI